MEKRFTTREFDRAEPQGLGLANGCLKEFNRQYRILAAVCIESWRQPAMPARQVAPCSQIEINLIKGPISLQRRLSYVFITMIHFETYKPLA
jgi:hypothetical protein